MKILSVGWFGTVSNTSLHRHWALEKCADHVDKVDAGIGKMGLSYRLAYHLFQKNIPIRVPDLSKANNRIKLLVENNTYDVIWIDKGVTINRSTLRFIKEKSPKTKIVSYSPDNMALRHNQSLNYLQSIPYYDFVFTNKSYILKDLERLGANNVTFIHNMYEETFHYPRELSLNDKERLGGDVGFVGAWEKERCESILFLVNNGIQVKVFGDGKWNEYKNASPNLTVLPGIFSEDYSKALQALKISLCFLRKMNFDQQTTRTMEIPACGGFMLAERTQEHLELFEEGKEAVYFSSNEELLESCRYYLSHEADRKRIAAAGLERCKTSGYSNEKTIKKMLDIVVAHG
ncbi:CgeB family protein [Maribacter polysaccharolyticus]|uniref:CgeB family protein n=1 Tax=Maribacter polysaccharolyticus TaxID=3020831 RepID=UPI00237F2F86|nr:glycosyltransferase [Maribacter polysaccharolyticus]MDE3741475.1 glycosyltransferase [Maribacter polysaccharolyticus]